MTKQSIKKLNICKEGFRFCLNRTEIQAWNECDRPEWLIYVAAKLVKPELLKKVKMNCMSLTGAREQPVEEVFSNYIKLRQNKQPYELEYALYCALKEVNISGEIGKKHESYYAHACIEHLLKFDFSLKGKCLEIIKNSLTLSVLRWQERLT